MSFCLWPDNDPKVYIKSEKDFSFEHFNFCIFHQLNFVQDSVKTKECTKKLSRVRLWSRPVRKIYKLYLYII